MKLCNIFLVILISLAIIPANGINKDKLIKKACELAAKKKLTLTGKAKKLYIKKCIAKKKKAAKKKKDNKKSKKDDKTKKGDSEERKTEKESSSR